MRHKLIVIVDSRAYSVAYLTRPTVADVRPLAFADRWSWLHRYVVTNESAVAFRCNLTPLPQVRTSSCAAS